MLVDLPPTVRADHLNKMVYGDNVEPRRVAPGVYLTHLNFSYDLKREGLLVADYPFDFAHVRSPEDREEMGEEEYFKRMREHYRRHTPLDYGVCDRWEQIVERWPEIVSSERRFIISITEMRREDQPSDGGWRWRKWGEYIGDYQPQHEYLHDETIDAVLTFHIMEVR